MRSQVKPQPRDPIMSLPKINRGHFAERWGDGASMKTLEREFGLKRRQVDYLRQALRLPARAMHGARQFDTRAHAVTPARRSTAERPNLQAASASCAATRLPTSATPLAPIRFIAEPSLARRMA